MLLSKKIHIFDLDGTLLDSMPYWGKSILSLLDEQGFCYPPDILNILTPLGIREGTKYLNSIGLDADVDTVQAATEKAMTEFYRSTVIIKPYVKEYLKKLKDGGCRLFILTASEPEFFTSCLKRNGIYDMFEKIWSCSYFSLPKSNPDIYFAAAKEINSKRSDIAFYDDNLGSLSGAMAANIFTVGVYDEASVADEDKIKRLTDKYIYSFSELF